MEAAITTLEQAGFPVQRSVNRCACGRRRPRDCAERDLLKASMTDLVRRDASRISNNAVPVADGQNQPLQH